MEQNTIQCGAKIKVIGCGGAGCNAINRMVNEGIRGVEFAAVNTDAQHLALSNASVKIMMGEKSTRGLGAGGRHEVGKKAAEESKREIENLVEGCDMVFVAAGMGGGTGTGSAPVVAEIAKKAGALTIGIVTKPFEFEGVARAQNAEEGLEELVKYVDTLVVVPNQKLFEYCNQRTPLSVDQAFQIADGVLCNGVKAISEIITGSGLINLDFADVRSIMTDGGAALMSIGRSNLNVKNRVYQAAVAAVTNPMLSTSLEGAKGILFNIVGDSSMTLPEVNEAAEFIRQQADPGANVIFGVTIDDNIDCIRLTIIATGFDTEDAINCEEVEEPYRENINTLCDMHTETELDIPSFLRSRSSYGNKRATVVPQYCTTQSVNPYSSYGSTYSVKPAFGQRSYATRRAW